MKRFLSVLFVFAIFLSACQAAPSAPTQIAAPTELPTLAPTSTNTPEPTLTPEPTATPEPSPTPIVLSDMIDQTFSGVSVVYRDGFESVEDGALPSGWNIEEKNAAAVTKDKQLKIKSAATENWGGTVFYFSQEKITPNTGVYFTFKYTGSREAFTLGFDAIRESGQRIINGDKGFYSVALQLGEQGLSAHIIQDTFQGDGYFKGNLNLQEDTWYDILLGYDDAGNYIIKIWEPDNIGKQLTYVRNWENFPTNYYFISWISAKRSLWIDDFTVFKFDSLFQK